MPLSSAQRQVLSKLAEAALPEGRLLPGADEQTVRRVEEGFARVPEAVGAALQRAAPPHPGCRLRHGRPRAGARREPWNKSDRDPYCQCIREHNVQP